MPVNPGQIPAAEAKQFVQNWNAARANPSLIKRILQPNWHFGIDANFNPVDLEGQLKAHCYLGLTASDNPSSEDIALIIIGLDQDAEYASNPSSDPYVYATPYAPGVGPQGDNPLAVSEINRWAVWYRQWVNQISASRAGLTRAFDTPASSILSTWGDDRQSNVFIGLRENTPAQDAINLWFNDPATENYADFTTPKPPFGSNNWGLL